MKPSYFLRPALAGISLAIVATLCTGLARAALPAGFSDSLVAALPQPTALAFTPDGRMLIATQPGQIHVYQNGELYPTPALDLSLDNRVCSNGERGLLGVAVDPEFSSNRFIYLYYVFNKFGICPMAQPSSPENPVSRVARFTLAPSNTVNLNSEQVLVDNIPMARSHVSGDLHFGKDGYLYASVGDGLCDYALDSGCAGNNDAARVSPAV
ncbi:MAG: PQQ-dependent sugar dehydrogenase [Gammaproteobacteria bacterium]|nr:PQQ-dependent sugar dehydrogenase [Gammaproteobacteria bacterium]